jgi:putative sterol carrier protein
VEGIRMDELEELETLIKEVIDKFNIQVQEDEKLKKQVEGMDRHIVLEFSDSDSSIRFYLKDNKISDFGRGKYDNPEIRIMSDVKTLAALIKKEMKPMKAIALGKVKFKASLTDLLAIKKLFGA